MGIVFRQSVKTSLVVFLGAFLGAFILWLSTKYIPKQEYGFMNSLTKWALAISVLAQLGLTSIISVFVHRYKSDFGRKKMMLTICLGLPLIAIALISAIYFALPEWILHHFQPADQPLMRKYYVWLPVYIVLFAYMTILEQYLCSQMRVAVSAFMREVLLRFLNIVLIVLFALDYVSFSTLVIFTVLLYIVPVAIFFLLSIYKTEGFGFSLNRNVFSVSEYKEMVHFSWYHYLLQASIMLMNYMDSILIPFYDHKGFATFAVYNVAVYFISLIYMPNRAFLQASYTAFARAYADDEMDKAKDIFVRSSVNSLIPTIGLALILCCNLYNAVAIIGNDRNYSGLIPVFLVLLIGQLVNVATGMNDQVLSVTNYYKFNFYTSLGISVLFYVLIRILVPHYGIIGAACASAITLSAYNIIKFYFVWKKTGMQPFSKNTVLIIIAALPALAAGCFFPYFFDPGRHVYVHTFVDAIIRSSIIIIVYMLMLIWLKPSKDLEEYIFSVKKNKRLF
jgi:O-antigen/teichoic acid export membrane protein